MFFDRVTYQDNLGLNNNTCLFIWSMFLKNSLILQLKVLFRTAVCTLFSLIILSIITGHLNLSLTNFGFRSSSPTVQLTVQGVPVLDTHPSTNDTKQLTVQGVPVLDTHPSTNDTKFLQILYFYQYQGPTPIDSFQKKMAFCYPFFIEDDWGSTIQATDVETEHGEVIMLSFDGPYRRIDPSYGHRYVPIRCYTKCYQIVLLLLAIPLYPFEYGVINNERRSFQSYFKHYLSLVPPFEPILGVETNNSRPIPKIGGYYRSVRPNQPKPLRLVYRTDEANEANNAGNTRDDSLYYEVQYNLEICFQKGRPADVIPLILKPIFKDLLGKLDRFDIRRLQTLGFKDFTLGFEMGGTVYTFRPFVSDKTQTHRIKVMDLSTGQMDHEWLIRKFIRTRFMYNGGMVE